jgi:hypothetical protein
MAKTLIRFALLLFVVSFVGLIGLNRSPNPARISTAHAASVDITLTDGGGGSTLDFSIGGAWCPETLAPGDSCTAEALVRNVGTESVTLSAPAVAESGVLETCTGDDPLNPGSGGNNLTSTVHDLSYTPNSTRISPNGEASFQVSFTFALAASNGCQGQTGTITVTVSATDVPVTTTATQPTVQQTAPVVVQQVPVVPQTVPVVVSTPLVQQIQAARQEAPAATFTQQVSPAKLPASGQGGLLAQDGRGVARLVLIGIGLCSAGLLILALGVSRNGRRSRP